MSHFIAHTISFSKDFKTFRVKGGDNNVVPRFNSWSNDIPIDRLYYNLNGGMIKLQGTSEKNAFIRHLVDSMDFGGDWENETDYFHVKNQKPDSLKLREFDAKFISELRHGLRNLVTTPRIIIAIKKAGTYVYKANPTHVITTMNRDAAKLFTPFRALEIFKSYQHKGAELITA